MAIIELKAPDFKPLQDTIDRLGNAMRNPQPLLKLWGVEVISQVGQNFQAVGRPGWKPLAPLTIDSRRVRGAGKGQGSVPLQNTGRLRRSFNIKSVDNSQVVIEASAPYAIFHEFGTKGPYTIRPKKPGGTLAFPGPQTKKSTAGKKGTLQGFRNVGGRNIPIHSGGRKAQGKITGLIFAKEVKHPGIVARPMLPTDAQIVPRLDAIGVAYLNKLKIP